MFSPPEHGLDGGQIARVMQELAAVKEGTTDATDRLLKAAETIEQTSTTLAAALKGGHEQGMAQDIQDQVTQIFEACNFHDLTSQRISKVVTTLKSVEDHLAQMVEIWNAIERFTNYVGRLAPADRRRINAQWPEARRRRGSRVAERHRRDVPLEHSFRVQRRAAGRLIAAMQPARAR